MEQLTSEQLTEWMAYDSLDPIGKWRDDFRTAQLSALLINIVNKLYAKPGTVPELISPLDMMIDWGIEKKEPEEPKKQSVETMKEIIYNIASIYGKKKNKK